MMSTPPPLPPARVSSAPARWRGWLAWLVVLAAVTLAAVPGLSDRLLASTQAGEEDEGLRPDFTIEMQSKIFVAAASLVKAGGEDIGKQMEAERRQLHASSGANKLRLAVVDGWLKGQALETAGVDSDLAKDAADFAGTMADGPLPEERRARLAARHGWFVALAETASLAEDHALRQGVTADASRLLMVLGGGVMLGLLLAAGGAVLLIMAILRWRAGRLLPMRPVMPATRGEGQLLVESFALYLVGFSVVPQLMRLLLPEGLRWISLCLVVLVLALAVWWPRLNGMPWAHWRGLMGWNTGRGFFREMGWGIVGWVAALPVIIVMLVLTGILVKITGQPTEHPIQEWVTGGGGMVLAAFLLASVWAPVSEETMFRGALLGGLRGTWRGISWVLSALLMALIFALLHPQGPAAVPALMTLAVIFALLRAWRGSLVAPMAAHMLHNGLLVLMLFLLT